MADPLSLILPAHNEEAVIEQAVREALEALDHLQLEGEVLVVDDGSTDGTPGILQKLANADSRVRVTRHPANLGYGAALRSGFEAARYPLVAFTDADCQFHLADLAHLIPLAKDHQIVTGWRVDRQDRPLRKFLSRGFNLLVDTLLGIRVRDVDCALKVFRKDALRPILPASTGFFANTEMLVRANRLGYRIAEVPVRHRPRAAGHSKVQMAAIPKVLSRLLPFWWLEVLHLAPPGTPGPGMEPHSRQRDSLTWFGLFSVLVLALGVFGLGNGAPLMEPTEARNAQIAKEMLDSGEWVVPQLEGKAYLDKPPLLYWTLMGLFSTLGDTDRVARIAPMFWCAGMVLAVWFWVYREHRAKTAFLCSLSLSLCLPFVHYGRLLAMDGLLGLCLLWAMVSIMEATRDGWFRWGWWLLASLMLALGLLAKGPIGLILCGIPLTVLAVLDSRLRQPGWIGWGLLVAISVLPFGIWSLLVERIHPGFVFDFFYTHHFVRFQEPIDHEEPFWFYLPQVALLAFPWSLGLLTLLRSYIRARQGSQPEYPPLAGTALVIFSLGFFFFSLAGCKRPSYLVPILPYLAILGGLMLDRWTREAPTLASLFPLGNSKARVFGAASLALGSVAMAIAAMKGMVSPLEATILGTLFGLGLLMIVLPTGKWHHSISWGKSLVASTLVAWACVSYLLPGYNGQFSIKAPLDSLAKSESNPDLVICYPQRYYSTSFYTPNARVEVFGSHEHRQLYETVRQKPDAIVLVKSQHALRSLSLDAPDGWEWETTKSRGQFHALKRAAAKIELAQGRSDQGH